MFLQLANFLVAAAPANPLAAVTPLLQQDAATLALLMDAQYSALARGVNAPLRAGGVPAIAGIPPGFAAAIPAPLPPALTAAQIAAVLPAPPPPTAAVEVGALAGAGKLLVDAVVPVPGAILATPGPSASIFLPPGITVTAPEASPVASYDHIIYAFLVENTGIVEIFRRVLRELLTGEGLPLQNEQTLFWVRATERLFFSGGLYPNPATISEIRPDAAANRRAVYFRLLGMELGQGADGGRSIPFDKGVGSNQQFAEIFERLLVQVGIAIDNASNNVGPNPTNIGELTELLAKLRNMLVERRRNGNLHEEEFAYTAMMSWLHLAILFDTPVVLSLGAGAQTADERLRRLGQRVGVPAHSLSRAQLLLAQDLSILLRLVEAGIFANPNNIQQLFAPGGSALRTLIEDVITQWSLATGKEIRTRRVAVVGATSAA